MQYDLFVWLANRNKTCDKCGVVFHGGAYSHYGKIYCSWACWPDGYRYLTRAGVDYDLAIKSEYGRPRG